MIQLRWSKKTCDIQGQEWATYWNGKKEKLGAVHIDILSILTLSLNQASHARLTHEGPEKSRDLPGLPQSWVIVVAQTRLKCGGQ